MLWYHDHAMGTSRLNLYAGMMGVYLLRDAHEAQPQPARGQL
jgi:spore coat protein A